MKVKHKTRRALRRHPVRRVAFILAALLLLRHLVLLGICLVGLAVLVGLIISRLTRIDRALTRAAVQTRPGGSRER